MIDQGKATASATRLRMLDSARSPSDLAAFPGNRLKPLKGNRTGQRSIRVDDRWRICLVWTDSGPDRVEIVDYH
jgi:toxin HigB-1